MSGPSLSLRRDLDIDAHAGALAERLLSRRLMGEYADPAQARAAAEHAALLVVAHGERWEVDLDGVVPHGHVVLVREADTVVVVDLRLDDLGLAAAVSELVADLARAEGAARLAVALPPGDLVRTAFVVGAGFRPLTCQLRLDLDHPLGPAGPAGPAGPGEVDLRPVTTAETDAAAVWIDAVDQHLLVGHEPGDPDAVVGTVWLSTARPMVLVQDLQVPPRRRQQGLGSALLRAAARWAQERGAHALGLDVAADDHVTRGLADHVGFHLVEDYCVRDL